MSITKKGVFKMGNNEATITRRKGKGTRAEILDVSLKLFVEKGFNATSMQGIADSAGITKGGLYYYVKNKDDILYSLHERFIQEGLSRLKKVDSMEMETDKKLVSLLKAHLLIIHDFFDDIKIFFREIDQLSTEKYKIVKTKRDKYERIFINTVEAGRLDGIFNIEDSKTFVLYMLGASNFMYQWYDPSGQMNIEDLSEIYIKFVLNGLS